MGRREAFPENAGAAASAVAPRLPLSALLAMAMSGFVAILSETLPAGLLPQIGAGLAVSEALAGQLVSVYALGSLLAALPAASLTQGWRRRRVLLLALLIFFVCNSLTAVSSDYRLTLLARFGSGVAAGLAWGLLAGYARRLVPPEQQGGRWRWPCSVRRWRCRSAFRWAPGWAACSAGAGPSACCR